MPRLADLVEDLVRRDPHEVGVHELHHRQVAAIHRQTAAQAGEGVLADRSAEHAIRETLPEPAGRTVGATFQAMDILAHDHYPGVGLHPPGHHVGHRIDEPAILQPALESGFLRGPGTLQFAEVATHADVAEIRTGPEFGANPPLAGLAARIGLGQRGHGALHRGLGPGAQLVDTVGVDQAALLHAPAEMLQRIARSPGLFLFLAAITEGAAGESAVLVEVTVDVGLDDGRPLAGAHVRQRLLHGQVDRQRVHAVDPPAGDIEGAAACRQTRLGGRLLDRGRHGVAIVLDEEAQR
ncbi:hypothetical protein FQZ97_915740 [compost metagenome]